METMHFVFIVFISLLLLENCNGGLSKFFKRLGNGVLVDHQHQSFDPLKKLATTPLFFISNVRGQQYLQDDVQSGAPKQKIVVHYMSSEDAGKHLEEYGQAQQQAGHLRIMTTTMENVMRSIQSKKQSRKLGRLEINNAYRIQPSERQVRNAKGVTGVFNPMSRYSIPMFTAYGMTIKRANGKEVVPYYFCLEDLKEDWAQLVQQHKEEGIKLPAKPKTRVRDFTDVMCLSKGLTVDTVANIQSDNRNVFKTLAHWVRARTTATRSSDDEKECSVPGIVPPRREIAMMKMPKDHVRTFFLN